jgi:tetratricopeptide (TPR) repeat protein
MRVLVTVLALACVTPGLALAQVDLVDPDAPQARPAKKPAPPPEDLDPYAGLATEEEEKEAPAPGDGTLVAPPTKKAPPPAAKGAVGKADPKAAELKKEPPPRAEPPKVVVKTISDADLNAAWVRWREANASKNAKAEGAARKELLALKRLTGTRNAELWSVGLLRAANAWEAAGDSGAAVEIAVTAAELAPDLPATWFLLSRLYFTSDPSGVGRYVEALQKGLVAQVSDPRYLRPMLADLSTLFFFALIGTACVVVFVLLARRGYYFLYDFHFFFPRAAARWQTSALAVLLLVVPIVFRMGVVPTLLGFFAAATLYLEMRERVVAAVLIGLLGFVPLAAQVVVERTAFADTPAEDLYAIERGGPGSEALVQHYERLAAEDKVGFPERYALGHFHLNRGHLEQAVNHLRGALRVRPEDGPARVALAKAFFLQGDLENSRSLLEEVKKSNPHPVVLFDLGRVYQRRVQVYGEANAREVDSANENLSNARAADPTLKIPPEDEGLVSEYVGNAMLKTLPLTKEDLLSLANGEEAGRRVRSQLSAMLSGDVPSGAAALYPAVVAALLLAFGLLAGSLEAAKACARCGRPVSRRGDPDLSPGSLMCSQCVNVFARKNMVAPSVKVRKQLEVARYEARIDRATTIFGVIWSGMGHVFAGLPVRGALYGFLFLLAILGGVLRHGVLRAPFDGLPMAMRLAPMALLFLGVYGVSLLRLRRRRG